MVAADGEIISSSLVASQTSQSQAGEESEVKRKRSHSKVQFGSPICVMCQSYFCFIYSAASFHLLFAASAKILLCVCDVGSIDEC